MAGVQDVGVTAAAGWPLTPGGSTGHGQLPPCSPYGAGSVGSAGNCLQLLATAAPQAQTPDRDVRDISIPADASKMLWTPSTGVPDDSPPPIEAIVPDDQTDLQPVLAVSAHHESEAEEDCGHIELRDGFESARLLMLRLRGSLGPSRAPPEIKLRALPAPPAKPSYPPMRASMPSEQASPQVGRPSPQKLAASTGSTPNWQHPLGGDAVAMAAASAGWAAPPELPPTFQAASASVATPSPARQQRWEEGQQKRDAEAQSMLPGGHRATSAGQLLLDMVRGTGPEDRGAGSALLQLIQGAGGGGGEAASDGWGSAAAVSSNGRNSSGWKQQSWDTSAYGTGGISGGSTAKVSASAQAQSQSQQRARAAIRQAAAEARGDLGRGVGQHGSSGGRGRRRG